MIAFVVIVITQKINCFLTTVLWAWNVEEYRTRSKIPVLPHILLYFLNTSSFLHFPFVTKVSSEYRQAHFSPTAERCLGLVTFQFDQKVITNTHSKQF